MAEFFLGPVYERLHSLIDTEFATISGIKEKAEKMSSTLDVIKAVIEDAEKKQITERSVKVWLQQLKDAAYELDDILDECSIHSHRLSGSRSLFRPKDIKLRHGLGKELEDIAERFNQIAEAKNKFSLSERVSERPSEAADWPQTISFLPEHPVYGRDEDKQKIMEFLLREAHCSDSLSIYPIVGLGGIGKTTLAQLVYNDEQVTKHFDIKIWVCVSDDFTVETILGSIINEKVVNLDAMARKVKELLQNKRYLLVLDDVWKANENLKLGLTQHRWNTLKSVLSCGSKGASILVSTRDEKVAAMMKTCQHHHSLSVLSDDDCWLLFKRCAFGTEEEDRPDLVEIGRELLQKCGKSPLAILALGGALRSMSTKAEWLHVRDSWLWETLPDEILPALRLSYFHLTPTLKQCFAFCAIFPKDTRIRKEQLIHLWMAHGFISSMRGLEVEKVGNRIWQELYQKSFFQDVESGYYSGDIFSFKMHDLVHDLAQSVMGQECLIMKNTDMADLSKSTHHISFDCSLELRVLEKVKSLRTLYQLKFRSDKEECSGYFPTKCSLRVLCISSFELSSLGNLIHLRYLELRNSKTETLPDSICSLQKLEILKLIGCGQLRCLPKHLSCLQNLRHLVIDNCSSLSDMFPNIGNLSCLRTLSKYIVSLEQGHSLSELQNLKLGGKLEITGLEFVGSKQEAGEANLREKEDLQELSLSWKTGIYRNSTNSTTAEQVLEGLEPHPNLNTLIIDGYQGCHFPRWIGGLTSLVTLELDGGRECKQLPSLGKLPLLRKLDSSGGMEIVYMDDDECYDGVEVMAFPSLEELTLYHLPKLKRLLKVETRNMCPRLSHLGIEDCPELELLPCHPSIKSLYFKGPNNKSLSSISSFIGLTSLVLEGDETRTMTSFPEGMMRNLTCLKTLEIWGFKELKELPDELFYLQALETLFIINCPELECLLEGIRHLTSLQDLYIRGCPTLIERCMKGTGEDWDKIAHVPRVNIE